MAHPITTLLFTFIGCVIANLIFTLISKEQNWEKAVEKIISQLILFIAYSLVLTFNGN